MKVLNIHIDDELLAEIEKRTTPDFDHNDVIQKLLKKALASPLPTNAPKTNSEPTPTVSSKNSILTFIQSPEFKIASGINKYLAVLAWVNKNRPKEFQKIEDYRKGNRIYFGRTQRQVEDSGKGINATEIPGSNVWALTTLDNRAKRSLLEDLLHIFNFPPGEINAVINSLPDSGRHRRENLFAQ
jgi:negative regulator of replication initiation